MSAQAAAAQRAAKAKAAAKGKPCAKAAAKGAAAMALKAVGVSGAPVLLDAPSGCSNAVCGVVVSVTRTTTKGSWLCSVDVGDDAPVAVESTFDVAEGARVAVAVAGSFVGDAEVRAKVVDGTTTGGRLCDAAMLGWDPIGTAKAAAAAMPPTLDVGETVPDERPRAAGRGAGEVDKMGNAVNANTDELENLYVTKAKLSKEDKELEKLEAKEAKRLAKLAKEGKEDAAEDGPRKPSKLDLARVKKTVRDKRSAGEEVYTDDEIEAAGFLV